MCPGGLGSTVKDFGKRPTVRVDTPAVCLTDLFGLATSAAGQTGDAAG
jgi:hypothetical protein